MKNEQIAKIEKDALKYTESQKGVIIENQEQYDHANEIIKEAKRRIKHIDDELDPAKRKAKEAYDEIRNKINELKKPYEELERRLKNLIKGYLIKKAEEEQKERDRIRKEEEDKRLKDAQVYAEAGMADKADKILDKRITIKKDKLPAIDKGGSSLSETWNAEIVNKMELIRAIAEGKASINIFIPNMTLLNQIARNEKNNMNIPGVKAKRDYSVSTRI